MSDDRAKLFSSLRASTVALLGYDAGQLTAAQEIRVDRAITLRLTIDDLQARQVRGEQIDVREFVDASESLERMIGGNPDAAVRSFDVGKARAKLARVLAGAVEQSDRDVAKDPDGARRSFEKHLAECVTKYGSSKPGGGDAPMQGAPPASPPPIAARDLPASASPSPWRPVVNEGGIISGPWGRR